MLVPINVKSPNNNSKWQMGFNSAFKGLILLLSRRHQHEAKCYVLETALSNEWTDLGFGTWKVRSLNGIDLLKSEAR
jgi:hypothetical protein